MQLKDLSKIFFNKIFILLFIFCLFIVYSCSIFSYNIENTTWKGTLLYTDIIVEFQFNGAVRLSSINLNYNYLNSRNYAIYSFNPQSLSGTITDDNEIFTFTINDKFNTLTMNFNGININLTKLDDGYNWPNIDFLYNTYKYFSSDYSYLRITFYDSNCYFRIYDSDTNEYYENYYSYIWNNSNYMGYIYTSGSTYKFTISFDKKYCIFDLDSDYPLYLELE